MTKTPDEIKKGMECCKPIWKGDHWKNCDIQCPYSAEACFCKTMLNQDTLALIQQLEATVSEKEKVISELSGKVGQLEAERDAAVDDLHYLVNHPHSAGSCYACAHTDDCYSGGDCDPIENDRWEWRGVQKEGKDEKT